MANVNIYNMNGDVVGSMELNDKIFGAEVNNSVHSHKDRGFRRRQKALETEGHRQSETGLHTFSSVDTRRRCSRPEAQIISRFYQQEG